MADEKAEASCDFFASLVHDHEQIELQLKKLWQAADALSRDESSAADLKLIVGTLDFFDREGAVHEDIEERTLFPRLRPLPEFKQIVGAIEFQHRFNGTATQELRACVDRFAPGGGRELRRLVVRFVEMHRGHAVAEERALFPLATSVLSPKVLDELARESRERKSGVRTRSAANSTDGVSRRTER